MPQSSGYLSPAKRLEKENKKAWAKNPVSVEPRPLFGKPVTNAGTNSNQLVELKGKVAGLESKMAKLETEDAVQDRKFAILQGEVDGLENKAVGLDGKCAMLQGKGDKLERTIVELHGKNDELEGSTAELQNMVVELQGKMDDLMLALVEAAILRKKQGGILQAVEKRLSEHEAGAVAATLDDGFEILYVEDTG